MKLTVMGTGYVGLVVAACMARSGHQVVGLDVDSRKVARLRKGKCPLHEPGLHEILQEETARGQLQFTCEAGEAIRHGAFVFIAVGTPSREDGEADLTHVRQAVQAVIEHADGPKILVLKSTVPVGTGQNLQRHLAGACKHEIQLVSNPEFLRQGTAVQDFMNPDRVILGSSRPEAVAKVRGLYRPFASPERILMMSSSAAEMVKYASNAFLATKISFINEIAEICSACGVDVEDVCRGMACDPRIGGRHLKAGIGYGGSCFPKDVAALTAIGRRLHVPCGILQGVQARNERQVALLAKAIHVRFGRDLRKRKLAIWGVAFKPHTDDIREAPALRLIRLLTRAGAEICCYDPAAEANARKALADCPQVAFASDRFEALAGAEALIICTEWPEFTLADLPRVLQIMKDKVVFDGRNHFDPAAAAAVGVEYYSIGRPVAGGESRCPEDSKAKPQSSPGAPQASGKPSAIAWRKTEPRSSPTV